MKKTNEPRSKPSLALFICYSRANQEEKKLLIKHLMPLAQRYKMELWHDELVPLGHSWEDAIRKKLGRMNLFLFLVSADSLASEFINQVEFVKAVERERKKKTDLIPILIQPCYWKAHDIEKYQFLPRNGQPVEDLEYWKNRAKGYANVAEELGKHLEKQYFNRSSPKVVRRLESKGKNTKENKSSNKRSHSNSEPPMYRESWTHMPSSNSSLLPLDLVLPFYKSLKQFRSELGLLESNYSNFKPELLQLLFRIGSLLKDLDDQFKTLEKMGHKLYRLLLETKGKVPEIRNNLIKASGTEAEGRALLLRIQNSDLVYFDHILERMEQELAFILKNDYDIQPN